MSKILNVGMPRTGNKSLVEALCYLGYRTEHYPDTLEVIASYDACTEVRFAIRTLIQRYPGSKYILTIRQSDPWLQSVQRVKGEMSPGLNPFWFRDPGRRLHEHLDRIVEVAGLVPPEDLLLFDICGGEGWDKLCPFLGREIPMIPFPQRDTMQNWPVAQRGIS